ILLSRPVLIFASADTCWWSTAPIRALPSPRCFGKITTGRWPPSRISAAATGLPVGNQPADTEQGHGAGADHRDKNGQPHSLDGAGGEPVIAGGRPPCQRRPQQPKGGNTDYQCCASVAV